MSGNLPEYDRLYLPEPFTVQKVVELAQVVDYKPSSQIRINGSTLPVTGANGNIDQVQDLFNRYPTIKPKRYDWNCIYKRT